MAKQPERREQRERRMNKRPRSIGRFQANFQHHQHVAVDSLERLFAEFGSSLLTWLVIGIALALPIFLMLLLQNLQQFGSGINDATQISLYMERGLSSTELASIEGVIDDRVDVASVEVISAEQALVEFQDVSGFGDALNGLDENPLPAVLLVNPASNELQQAETLLTAMSELAGVDSAQLDLEWVQRLYSILALAQRMTLILAGLLCLGVILVVGNTVRLAIESRRTEIVVVKLVGGTDSYVGRPFLYTGFWYGVGGGIIASLLVIVAKFALQGSVSNVAGLYESSFSLIGLKISSVLLVLLGSGALGWIGAWLSVLRHLKAIEPR